MDNSKSKALKELYALTDAKADAKAEKTQQVWDTKSITKTRELLEQGLMPNTDCFWTFDPQFRAANIAFKYTKEELIEYAKCANDINYFADRYAFAMTDNGVAKIELRPYQRRILKAFQEHREVVLMSSRQAGKTITSSIYIAWYVCFHFDRNCLIVANKQVTAGEIVGKIKDVIKNLPIFLQPGVVAGGMGGMVFDNGAKLFSQATSKTAGLGFAIHLLYADEFAHIPGNFVTAFYRSIYPTLSSSQISQIIITSTPNGLNLFEQIYSGAVAGTNTYHAERVDWWEIPGRDEAWKKKEIANLGSEELFEQEYGNQFLNSKSSMINSDIERLLKKTTSKYIYKNLHLENPSIDSQTTTSMKWHQDFNPKDIHKNDRFVVTIDLAEGAGGDYTILNFFKLEPKSKAKIKTSEIYQNENDFFRLKQVGIFSSNNTGLPKVAEFLMNVIGTVINPENITLVLEINFKGSYFQEMIQNYDHFYDDMMLRTYHSFSSKNRKPGVRMRSDNKNVFAIELRQRLMNRDVIITEDKTFTQLAEFGVNEKGNFEGAGKHDDKAMSVLLLMSYMTEKHYEMDIDLMMDLINEDVAHAIRKKLYGKEEMDKNIDLTEKPDWLNPSYGPLNAFGVNSKLNPEQGAILSNILKGKH